jgi:hypothetical protein
MSTNLIRFDCFFEILKIFEKIKIPEKYDKIQKPIDLIYLKRLLFFIKKKERFEPRRLLLQWYSRWHDVPELISNDLK